MRRPVAHRRFAALYGIAHGGKSLFWHAGELLFAYYLTEACGLSPDRMGALLGISLLLSALADLLVGMALRRRVRSLEVAGRVQLLGAGASAVAFAAFGMSNLAPAGDARLVFACATLVVFRLVYALLDTPQNALLALASSEDTSRARLSSIRYVAGGLANIMVALAFTPLFNNGARGDQFASFAVLLSVVGISSAYALFSYLRGVAKSFSDEPLVGAAQAPVRYRRWPIFVTLFAVSAAMSIFGRLEPYFAVYGVQSALRGTTLVTCVAAGTLVSQPFWAYVARKSSLPRTLQCSAAALVTVSLVLGILAESDPVGVAFGASLYGGCCGGVLMSLWALAAAVSDSHVQPTVVFGTMTCVSKVALALAAFVVARMLATTPYREHAAASLWILPSMIAAPVLAGLIGLMLSAWVELRPTRPGPVPG